MEVILKTESQIQAEMCKWLEARGFFFWRQNNIPVYGRALPKWTPKGLPDILVIYKEKFVALEVKRPEGIYKDRKRKPTATPDQLHFKRRVEEAGGLYFFVTSIEELHNAMRSLPEVL